MKAISHKPLAFNSITGILCKLREKSGWIFYTFRYIWR